MRLNVLALAHRNIPYEKVTFYKWIGSIQRDNLLEENQYAPPVLAKVKVNAVSTQLLKQKGLDLKRNYVKLFSIPRVSGLSRINNGDQFEFEGVRYQVEKQTGWVKTAGWDSFRCVDVEIYDGEDE